MGEGHTRAPLGQWFSTGPAVRPEDVRPRLRTLPVTVAGAVLPAPSRPRQRCCRTPRSAQDGPATRSGLARHAGGAEGERPCRVTLSLGTPLLQGCPRARSCPAGLPASEFAFQYEPSEGPPRGAGTYCSRALDPSASPVLLPPAHPPLSAEACPDSAGLSVLAGHLHTADRTVAWPLAPPQCREMEAACKRGDMERWDSATCWVPLSCLSVQSHRGKWQFKGCDHVRLSGGRVSGSPFLTFSTSAPNRH